MKTINKEFLTYIRDLVKSVMIMWKSPIKLKLSHYISSVEYMANEIHRKFDGIIQAKHISYKWNYSDDTPNNSGYDATDNSGYYSETLSISVPFNKPTLNDKINSVDIVFRDSYSSNQITIRFNIDDEGFYDDSHKVIYPNISFNYDSDDTITDSNKKFLEWLNS